MSKSAPGVEFRAEFPATWSAGPLQYQPTFKAFAASPGPIKLTLDKAIRCDAESPIEPEGLRAVLAAAHRLHPFTGLTFRTQSANLGDPRWHCLLEFKDGESGLRLEFSSAPGGETALFAALAEVPSLERLRIETWYNKFSCDLSPLFALPNVKEFNLQDAYHASRSWVGLSRWQKLEKLELHRGVYGPEFWAELDRCPALAKFDLWSCDGGRAREPGRSPVATVAIMHCHDRFPDVSAWLPGLTGLRRLAIEHCHVGDDVARNLKPVPGVEHLKATDLKIGDAGLGHFLAAFDPVAIELGFGDKCGDVSAGFRSISRLRRLRSARVTSGGKLLDPEAWRALGELPALADVWLNARESYDPLAALGVLPALEKLLVYANSSYTSAGWDVLAATPTLRDFHGHGFTGLHDPGPMFDALARAEQIRGLMLWHCDAATDKHLARLAGRPGLEALDVSEMPKASDAGIVPLVGSPTLRKVRLHKIPKLTDAAPAALPPSLTELSLKFGAKATPAGLRSLTRLTRIEILDLDNARHLSDEILAELVAAMPSLRELTLDLCPLLTDASADLLAAAPAMRKVRIAACKGITATALFELEETLRGRVASS